MRIDYNGNVGVGTVDTKGYKFAVAGAMVAEAVTVKLQGNWPDYVFSPTYNLLSLVDVKAYIDKNKHLPEMPSEEKVIKDGVNLGEMVRLQTKKIEELTLYLIKQDQRLQTQQKANSSLQKRINKLEKRIK